MTRKAKERPVFIATTITHERQVSEVLTILWRFGIPVEVVERGERTQEPKTILLRIAHDRATEAVLALEFHGFEHVRAYEQMSPQGARWRTN